MAKKNEIIVKDVAIKTISKDGIDYISITDIARQKNATDPNGVIANWMRNRNTVEFLGIWETLHNPNFNPLEFEGFRKEAGLNAFTLSPTRWIEATNAIGIVSQAGRYGGTFAQTDIAFEFASWISVEFRLYLVMEFQRLKAKEQESLGWTAKRELSKINYRIHTDAIKSHLIPEEITSAQASIIYAEEADVLNVAMFGMTAKQWREANPDLRNTGLFFFRGNSNAPFAICNAGGGFSYVGAMHDSFPHALELSKQGYNAFALIYRPGDAYEDLARVITYICDHADELGVQRDGYSLWGDSAGARMAATLGNSANLRSLTGRTDLPQASVVIMQYTGYTTVSQYDGPTYACCGTNDGIASWRTMQSRLESLSALGIPTEFHSYNGLPHGFGLGTGTVAEGWLQDAIRFWQQQSGATAIRSAKANTKPSDTIYSLNGIRHNSLQPGVNIVDGRKVVILKYSAKRQ